ncbi:helical backbone metal receptor [Acidiferrimicrobium sp. IK]|uniref:helical backbone metal receptor n=1 Tax=Acidiferrimicrobium sp. IK TaxID=2871700 RepID=UPI0021CAEF80|nr:helical backbone metal receptor [Acidiferrimicrobium sp. IK]MCU4183802.1 helical backbone metal receptor [Acidiferrimicrobium sp. IK]
MRVVSLVPSATETLRAWGVDPVAVTRFCEQPDLPTVGGTKNPDIEAIAALRPDLVVLDREENRREDAEALAAAGIPLHVLHITGVEDVEEALDGMARAVGAEEVEKGAVTPAPPARPAVPVWVPIWRRPWMAIGNGTYGASLLAAAGFQVRAGGDGRYPEEDLRRVAALGVSFVLAPSEPYPFKERHRRELEVVAPVEMVDGKDLFWWGVRTPAALARLRVLGEALRARAAAGR